MRRMYAYVTDSGTAISETALCEVHRHTHEHIAPMPPDAMIDRFGFVDCTGNDLLSCIVCGYSVNTREVVVLNDGTTYTARDGCVALTVPDDIDDDEIDEYVAAHAWEGRAI